MFVKRAILLVLAATIFLGYGGCPPQDSGQTNNDNNLLLARPWGQAFAGKENSGFNAVHSTYALAPLQKWSASVGELTYSGPVVGPDGAIYVGTATGDLVALNPDGTQRWRRNLAQSILASPAINEQTHDIFVIGEEGDSNSYVSRIYSLDEVGALHRSSDATFSVSAAPKLWGDYIFVEANGRLSVFDQATLSLVGHVDTNPCFNIVCGGPDFTSWGGVLNDLFICIVTLGTGQLLGIAQCTASFHPMPGPTQEPSVAILDSDNLVDDPNQPTIVVVSTQCASAYRFHPAGDAPTTNPPIDSHFEILWSRALVEVDCEFKTVRSTTPAAVLGGQILIGDENGRLLSLDALTGNEFWHLNLGEAIQCPPVVSFRQIYVVTEHKLVVVDSNGVLLNELPIQGIGQGAALSIDYVYVVTTAGVHTFALNPDQGFAFDGSIANDTNVGTAFPALAEDGTLYVSVPTGFVHAYAYGQGFAARLVSIPQVAWLTPADGDTLSYAPGQALSASVAAADGGAFDGTVTFASDVDGTLCEDDNPGATATCTTSSPLSLGTHQLTVFANDSGGGTNSAVISVQVVDTPPTVSITQPAESASFLDSDTITFEATVADPEEPNFPPQQVQWTSDVAGELGSGLTFTRRLGAGQHTITATATDEHGQTGQASVHIAVQGDTAPTVKITQPADGTRFYDTDKITFQASVTDPEEPNFPADHVAWRSDLAGDLGTGTTLQHALPAGDHTITVRATDAQGVFGEASVHLHVVTNTPPTVTITSPVEGDMFSDIHVVTFAATVTDPDETISPDQVHWSSDVAGDLGTGLSFERTLPMGDQTVTATATDSQGASGDASVHVKVVGN